MNLVWLPEDRDDIERLFEFLLPRDAEAAGRAMRTIRAGAQELLEFPRAGRPLDDETGRREFLIPFGAAAYVLRYLVLDEQIVVIRVWHSREKRV